MIRKILMIGLAFFLTMSLLSCSYSEGEKVGTIVKLADEGYVFKTHEGQLIRGGFNNGSGVMGKPFDFTIADSKLFPIAHIALVEGKEVRIKYHQELFAPLSSGNDGNYFVDSIEIINQENKK